MASFCSEENTSSWGEGGSTLSFTRISRSLFEWLSERFEWNADDHGWDRFSLIAFLRVDALRA
ncbi:MAG: hypothetical protein DWQ29_10700 [Planctomycetota bacterium]|nr:MAG: hypothetical protein DWQ29_10700 [Planctomycetota bacterium]